MVLLTSAQGGGVRATDGKEEETNTASNSRMTISLFHAQKVDKKRAIETGGELLFRRSEKRGAENILWKEIQIRLRRSPELIEGVDERW